MHMEIISDFDHRFTMKHGEKSQHGVAMKSMDLIVGVPMLVVSAELNMLECIHGEVGSNHETW